MRCKSLWIKAKCLNVNEKKVTDCSFKQLVLLKTIQIHLVWLINSIISNILIKNTMLTHKQSTNPSCNPNQHNPIKIIDFRCHHCLTVETCISRAWSDTVQSNEDCVSILVFLTCHSAKRQHFPPPTQLSELSRKKNI